jgi:hypothetical protein
MMVDRDDPVLTDTLERIRRAELACVLYPPGTPEHARAVERLDQATRQMRRLADASNTHDPDDPSPGASGGADPVGADPMGVDRTD